MQSLLGKFYSRIRGSQENIASEGLVYILQRSKSARTAIIKILKSECGLDFKDLNFITQDTGDNLERPDISGYDNDLNEVVIIEAKFWAALTDSQPKEYLRRLHENSVLIFVCPTLRIRSIFEEIHKRLTRYEFSFTLNAENHSFSIEDTKQLIIKTWDEILGAVKLQLVQNNEIELISDINQIIGLCNTIDNDSFLPIQSDDLSPKYARKIKSYIDLIDKVVDELKKQKFADTVGLKASPQKYGYTRYLKIKKFGVSINMNIDLWTSSYADTPFWISIKEISGNNWIRTGQLRKETNNIASQLGFSILETPSKELYIALFPPLDKTEDIVIKELSNQIILLTTNLDKKLNNS